MSLLVLHNLNYHEQTERLYGWFGRGILSLQCIWQLQREPGRVIPTLTRRNELCLDEGWERDEQLVELLKGWEPYTSSDTGGLPQPEHSPSST